MFNGFELLVLLCQLFEFKLMVPNFGPFIFHDIWVFRLVLKRPEGIKIIVLGIDGKSLYLDFKLWILIFSHEFKDVKKVTILAHISKSEWLCFFETLKVIDWEFFLEYLMTNLLKIVSRSKFIENDLEYT